MVKLAELRISEGADIKATDDKGRTPLYHSQGRGHTEIAELLKKHEEKE